MVSLVESLISEPSDEVTDRVFEDQNEIVWIDWREDDLDIPDYFESKIQSGKLRSFRVNSDLYIEYGEKKEKVPLTDSSADRHITILSVNKILFPEFEVRLVWDAEGGDTGAFVILSSDSWKELESRYGKDAVRRAFLELTPELNTFSDPLHRHKPGVKKQKPWWRVW